MTHNVTVGVVGGMGPLASASFLQTLYAGEFNDAEQSLPRVILYSDPTIPDRTSAFAGVGSERLRLGLVRTLQRLSRERPDVVVICCLTIHHFVPELQSMKRWPIRSLVDIITESMRSSTERRLMLCSTGCRNMEVFQRHPDWHMVARLVVWPDEEDQDQVHRLIYQLKRGGSPAGAATALRGLTRKYGVDGFIAGCTEFHLVAQCRESQETVEWLDPLTIVAGEIRRMLG